MDRREHARAFYDAIDAGDYERLAGLLADDFRHDRPEATLDGRDAFVAFTRDERPETDTTHLVDAVYEATAGVAVEGRLRRADESIWFRFVDTFAFADGAIARVQTYTHPG